VVTDCPINARPYEAADNDRLFGLFFREYDNRYKYCHHTSYVLADPSMARRVS
jgi:hypothetical protein